MADTVTICVCTFRRPSLFNTLASFERLEGLAPYRVSVVVADNDDTDTLRKAVVDYARDARFPICYVHAPARNISIARNAALSHCNSRWAAFIDDDETAEPGWLAALMDHREGTRAVIGQCTAKYDAAMPGWLKRCDFHSNRIGSDPVNAYTSNALIDVAFVREHGIAFRNNLGRTGGEDTLFFRALDAAGGRIVYCPEAEVREPVAAGRANMRWVLTRNMRAGQTHGLMLSHYDRSAFSRLAATALAKSAFSLAMALISLPGTDGSRRWLARSALHYGALRYRMTPHIHEEYG